MGLFDLFKRKKPEPEVQPELQQLEPQPLEAPAVTSPPVVQAPASGVARMRQALNRTRAFFATAFATDPSLLADDDYFDTVVDNLVLADVGTELAGELAEQVRREMANRGVVRQRDVPPVARDVLAQALRDVRQPVPLSPDRLSVVLLVGVNGSGKTTLAAKLAHRLNGDGRRVLLGGGGHLPRRGGGAAEDLGRARRGGHRGRPAGRRSRQRGLRRGAGGAGAQH